MSFIYIDRRKAGKGKSTSNRQKLLKRVRSYIKSSIPQNIGAGGVTGTNAAGSSPVKVAAEALDEPFFCYAKDGEEVAIVIGNDQYDRGDEIEFPESGEGEGEGEGEGGQGNGGEDDFIVNVARSEFLDMFFEDCELHLTHEKFTDKLDNKFERAGFSTTGSPAQLSIIRSFKQSLARRWALMKPYTEELEELKKELELLSALQQPDADQVARKEAVLARIEELKNKLIFLDSFDKSDLRFRKHEAKPLKTADAVLVMMMDISGSMDKEKKTIARRWFALLYEFCRRRYPNIELVFLAHTDEVFEMEEDDFFSTRKNGGTKVSVALEYLDKMIRQRWDPNQTDIIVCHASDGDNWEDDSGEVRRVMLDGTSERGGGLMNKISMFSYVEVGKPMTVGWLNLSKKSGEDTNLWTSYDHVRTKCPPRKVSLSIIETADECYSVFKKVFKKVKND